MSPLRSMQLLGRVAVWLAASLFLFTLNAAAQGTCESNFTQGGDAARGLTFATSRTIRDLAPRDALTQYKQIAQGQGFKIGRESVGSRDGELTVSQLPSINARGFDMHVQADETGRVSISTTLPSGMKATPDAFRNTMCTALNKLKVRGGGSGPANASLPPVVRNPTPQESTDICMANFIVSGTTVEGETYSTWSLGTAMDVPSAIGNLKNFTSQVKTMHLSTGAIHGRKATLAIALDNAAVVFDGDLSVNDHDVRGFTMRLDLDAALDAVSFSAHTNKEQQSINRDRMRRLACTLIAIAANGAPLSDEKKPSRFRNPFKNLQKAAKEQRNEEVQLMKQARVQLYQRAIQAHKAIVFMPMTNVDAKYAQVLPKELIPGGSRHQPYRFDQTATLVWRSTADSKDVVKVGDRASLIREGIFGYVLSESANKTKYGIYIVTPGSYDLIGLTYDLVHTSLPGLNARRWVASPKLGMASFVITRDAEFTSHQAWSGAQFEKVKVYDGTSCPFVVGGMPGIGVCAGGAAQYHTESRVKHAAGWQTVVDKSYAGGLQATIALATPFAHFDVKPGAIIVTDGFAAVPDSVAYNHDACRQQDDNLIDCGIKSFKLFRIPGRASELLIPAETAAKVPMIADFTAKATYQPVDIEATPLEAPPGTYEAAWARPYSLSSH